MTNDRPVEPHGPQTQPGGINYNDIDMSSRTRVDQRVDQRTDVRTGDVRTGDQRTDVRTGDVRTGDQRTDVRTGDVRNSAHGGAGGSSQINDSSRTNYYGGSASAPNVYASGFCSEGGSAGVYILGIGVSGGKSTINESCLKMRDFQETMQSVCKASDEHAQVALSSFQLELAAGREIDSNPLAASVGRRVSRISDAKALSSMQLDNVCTTLASGSTANVETLKAAGLDRPLIIVEPAKNASEQRILDEALVTKVEQIDRAVKGLQERPIIIENKVEVGVAVIDVAPPAPPKPVHRPPSHKPPTPKAKDDDCDNPDVKKKK